MQKALLYVASLVVLLTAAFLVWSKAPRLEEPQMATTTAPVEMTVVENREETDTYSIEIRYPQFGIEAVDAAVQAAVDGAVEAFKSYPVDEPPVDAIPKNEQVISFNSVYTGDRYASVGLLISEYTGGAHPNSVIIGVNVDRTTGSELTLDDALALLGMSLREVADSTRVRLSERLGEAFFEDGAAATSENYGTFLIDADEVTFVFNTYQVAPYAAGPQLVSFPRATDN